MKSLKIQCDACGGTGLYKGFGEADGAYVVCRQCQGKGYIHFAYEEFTEKKKVNDCNRVYKDGCGYCITDKDIIDKNGKIMRFSKYGCTYEEWLNGVEPKPIEFLDCPNHHTGWKRPCKNCKDLLLGESFRDCPHFENVEECWKEFNKEK